MFFIGNKILQKETEMAHATLSEGETALLAKTKKI